MQDFDFLARHYNAMTGYPGRIDSLAAAIQPWVERWNTQRALDAGCGGGVLMLALDKLGVNVVGTDYSEGMLKLTADNVHEQGREFQIIQTGHESVGTLFPSTFDTVFCLGNAVVGAGDDPQMVEWLSGLRDALKPGGRILLQILNFYPFLTGLKTLINRRKVGENEYVRIARPLDGRLGFCAMCLESGGEVDAHFGLWERWERDRFATCVEKTGFAEVTVYGGLDRSEFVQSLSTDVVIAARRPV